MLPMQCLGKVEDLPNNTMYLYMEGWCFLFATGRRFRQREKNMPLSCVWAMNGKNQPVVTNEPVEFEVQDFQKNRRSFWRTLWNTTEISERKREDYNMWPVGLGNTTRILANYACPKTSLDIGCEHVNNLNEGKLLYWLKLNWIKLRFD